MEFYPINCLKRTAFKVEFTVNWKAVRPFFVYLKSINLFSTHSTTCYRFYPSRFWIFVKKSTFHDYIKYENFWKSITRKINQKKKTKINFFYVIGFILVDFGFLVKRLHFMIKSSTNDFIFGRKMYSYICIRRYIWLIYTMKFVFVSVLISQYISSFCRLYKISNWKGHNTNWKETPMIDICVFMFETLNVWQISFVGFCIFSKFDIIINENISKK